MKEETRDSCAAKSVKEVRVAVAYRPIEELKLHPDNPRQHTPGQVRKIARSITIFGFLIPVLIDAVGNVLAGHGRILAARQLGWSDIPVICIDHLTDAQARAFMIADNRLSEISTWNDRLLNEQLKELSAVELDFDLEVTGFDTGEIDLRIQEPDTAKVKTIRPTQCLKNPRDHRSHAGAMCFCWVLIASAAAARSIPRYTR